MPRKKNTDTETSKIDVTNEKNDINIFGEVSANMVSDTNLKVKEISLNQKVESFFGVANIWLTHDNYSAKVPDNLTASEKQIIQRALNRGLIVEGNEYIPPIDKDESVLDEYWHLVKTYGLDASDNKSLSMIAFRKLFKLGADRNWTAKEIANFCIEKESKSKGRDRVIRLLKDVHRFSGSLDTLLEAK